MRLFRCCLAALLAAGIVTVVAAQPGGGGFGGGTPDVENLVFTNAAVQDDLKITDAQKEKFKPVVDKQTETGKKFREAFSGGKFDKDKFADLNKEREANSEEAKKVRNEVLTDAQKKRLKQIQTQAMTFSVFNDPEAKGGKGGGNFGGFGGPTELQKEIMKDTQAALKLSDSQKSSIKGIVTDFGKERQEIYKDAGISFGKGGGKADPEKREAADKKVEKVRKEAWGKVVDLFDDSQKKTWKELTGDPFDTEKLRPVVPKKD
jgi:hypothetical protein